MGEAEAPPMRGGATINILFPRSAMYVACVAMCSYTYIVSASHLLLLLHDLLNSEERTTTDDGASDGWTDD